MNNLWIELVVNGLLARHERGAAMLIQCLKREVEECHEQIAALETEQRFLRYQLACERARLEALLPPDLSLKDMFRE